MNNHEGLLRKYFMQAKEQPSLLSPDQARTILLQAGESQKHTIKESGSRGIIVTFVIGAAVMVTFLSLPHSNNTVEPAPQTVADNSGATLSAQRTLPNILNKNESRTGLAAGLSQSRKEGPLGETTASASAESITPESFPAGTNPTERQYPTQRQSFGGSFSQLSANSDIDLPSLSYDDLRRDLEERSSGSASVRANEIGTIDLPDRPALGYTVAHTNLMPLPELRMLPGKIAISRLPGLNTPYYDDYNPMITADGRTLYFISNREHGLGGHDFWVARKKSRQDLLFSEPQNLGSGINTSRDEGSASISADGQTMYFTGCHRPDGLGECDIYEARLQEEGWMEVRNLREINSRYWEAQPTVSADGRALYFVSNRPGVLGGHEDADIHVSYKMADGTWSKPENLGKPINTTQREDSPFIAPGGDAIYFSSAGHKGMGGLDFYVSHKGEGGDWQKPENLGATFNTSNDERFITLPAAEDVIYFASSDGNGGLDLFMARRDASSSSIVLNGSIIRAESGKSLNAHLLFVDGETGEVLAGTRTNDETDEFSLVIGESSTDRVIYVYGVTDSLGEFRAKVALPSTDSYREYRCDFILASDGSGSPNIDGEWTPELRVTTGSAPDRITIEVPAGEWGELAILDAWGHQLMQKFIRSDNPEQIDLSTAPDGLYLARMGRNMAVIPIDRRRQSGYN